MRTTSVQLVKKKEQKGLTVKLSESVRLRPMKERETIGAKPGAIPKIDRYGWQLKDSPGKYADVPKDDLKIDPRYQRHLTDTKVNSIARDWSWVACGCLTCAVREDGSIYVVEGQHRHAAAMKRSDIKRLPCLLFEVPGVVEEAKGFLDTNTLRKPLAMFERFKALLQAGDKVAIRAQEIMKLHNYTPVPQTASEGRVLRCLRSFMNCIEQDEAALSRVFPLVVKACEGGIIDERILVGMFYLEMHCTVSLSTPRWESRIVKFKKADYISAIVRTVAAYEKGGNRQWALGILMLLNKALQENRMLRLKDNP